MEDHLRVELPEHVVQPGRYANVAYNRREAKLRITLLKLKAEVVHRCLGVVVQHELPHAERRQLAA